MGFFSGLFSKKRERAGAKAAGAARTGSKALNARFRFALGRRPRNALRTGFFADQHRYQTRRKEKTAYRIFKCGVE